MNHKKYFSLILLIVGVGFLFAACDTVDDIEDYNVVLGTVSMEEEEDYTPVENVTVYLNGRETQTDKEGNFGFEDVEDGEYLLEFYKDDVIEDFKSIYVSGGETLTLDLNFSKTGNIIDDSLIEGKQFVDNLRDHGVNLTTLSKEQAQVMETALVEEMIPYSEAAGIRIMKIGKWIDYWRTYLIDGPPGEYVIIRDEDGESKVDEYPEYDEDKFEAEEWIWTLKLEDWEGENKNHIIEITITNLQQIYSVEEIEESDHDSHLIYEFDFSEAIFEYDHKRYVDDQQDESFDWNFDFTLQSTAEHMIEETEIYEDDDFSQKIETYITIPIDPAINITGKLTDEIGYNEGELADIGELIVDFELNIDALDEKEITYSGLIKSPVFEYNGDAGIYFSLFPEFEALINQEEVPRLESLYFEEDFTVYNYFKTEGRIDVTFIDKEVQDKNLIISLPDMIETNGKYIDLSGDNAENNFTYEGFLNLDLNLEEYELTFEEEFDDEENFITGSLSLNGVLKNTGFEDVELIADFTRTDFKEMDVNFEYYFDGHRFIKGTGIFSEEEFTFNATNELDQQIKINLPPQNSKIGELLNQDQEILAEIKFDEEPYFQFTDGDVIGLFPGGMWDEER